MLQSHMFQPGAGLTMAQEAVSLPDTEAGDQVIAVTVNLVAAAGH